MSQQTNTVKYHIETNAIDSGGPVGYFTSGDGWTDDFALKVDAALRALTWPADCQYIGIQKVVDNNTLYELDTSTNPPHFA